MKGRLEAAQGSSKNPGEEHLFECKACSHHPPLQDHLRGMQGEISKDPHTWPCSQGPPFNPPGSAWFLETSVEGHLSGSGQFRKPGLPRDPAPDTPATCCLRGSVRRAGVSVAKGASSPTALVCTGGQCTPLR